MTYDKINKRLDKQEEIEGPSEDLELLRRIIREKIVKTGSEWRALTRTGSHRYGVYSYQIHIFNYPSEMLRKLLALSD